jgi:hypothetical protein
LIYQQDATAIENGPKQGDALLSLFPGYFRIRYQEGPREPGGLELDGKHLILSVLMMLIYWTKL